MRYIILVILLHGLILASPSAHAKVKGIGIVGERHSGTNFIRDLLRATLDHQPDHFFVDERLCGRTGSIDLNRQRFKHNFQFPDFNDCNLNERLIIVMLRNPFDWSLSMRKHCWCTPRGPGHGRNPFELTPIGTFASLPWIKDDLYSTIPPVDDLYSGSMYIGHNRTPGSPSFDNVLHLRACKLKNHLDISSWAPHVVYLHQEDTLESEVMWKWLRGLVHNYSLPRRTTFTEPAIDRVFKLYSATGPTNVKRNMTAADPAAIASLKKVWEYIDNSNSSILSSVKISYLGSLAVHHKRESGWSSEYNADSVKLKSLWFNHQNLIAADPKLMQHVINVNRLMYDEIEARAGYHKLDGAVLDPQGIKSNKKLECGW